MGAVGVELADDLVVALERPRETGDVGHAEPGLLTAMEDIDPRVARGEFVGPLPRAVRGAVIDDEDVDCGLMLEETGEGHGQGKPFVVCGDDDEDLWNHGPHPTPAQGETMSRHPRLRTTMCRASQPQSTASYLMTGASAPSHARWNVNDESNRT